MVPSPALPTVRARARGCPSHRHPAAARRWLRGAAAVALAVVAARPAAAQRLDPDELAARQRACAAAVAAFVADYEVDRLAPRGPLRQQSGLQPKYARIAGRADLLHDADFGNRVHVEALQKILLFAEAHPDVPTGQAVLALAGAGLDKSLFDRDAKVLRDLGHWTLMRMDHQGVWFAVMRTAAGDQLPFLDDDGGDAGPGTARRVAALKLLGMKGLPVFRGTIEGALSDLDPRVRLAAVEALDYQRRPHSLPVLVRVMAVERHPVVSQAVVGAVLRILDQHADVLARDDVDDAVRTAVRLLGRCGWRTDMELVDLVERFPAKAAIPTLIETLDHRDKPRDELVELVNRNASPRLRVRAHEVLRGMTGAIIPLEDVDAWRRFWGTEQDKIRVPETLPKHRDGGNTASTFFGIPVTGREIAFVIDTSGSMKQPVGGGPVTGRRSDDRDKSRLDLAKEQLLLAVQSMNPESRYHLLTFSASARTWSRKAVPPGANSTRSLTELLSRFEAEGGTNVYDALAAAMSIGEAGFGEQADGGVDEMFLLSDGKPTEGQVRDTDEILELVREANKYLKIRINTVFSGSGAGAGFLERLAKENGGVFVQR